MTYGRREQWKSGVAAGSGATSSFLLDFRESPQFCDGVARSPFGFAVLCFLRQWLLGTV